MPESVKASVAGSGLLQVEHNELSRQVLQESDVLYVTRVQKERFNSEQEYLELADAFVVRKLMPMDLSKFNSENVLDFI